MTQVVRGVLYLHSHGIIHRDLTLGNILLTKEMDAVSFFMISSKGGKKQVVHSTVGILKSLL